MRRRLRRPTRGDDAGAAAVGAAIELSRTRNGRWLLALGLLVLLLVAGWRWTWDRYFRPRHPVGPAVRVATWNLRHFSERPEIDLRAVAEVIRASHFDVVAVQEVKQRGEAVDALLNTLGPPWRATSLSETTGNYERFVFLYNGDRVAEVPGAGGSRFVSGEGLAVFARRPYQATFRAGQFDFTLVTVHLSFDDIKRRRREAEALGPLARQIAEQSAEKDVILLGDFNAETDKDLAPLTAAGWLSLNRDPTNLGSSEVYDTLLIDPNHTREWNGTAGAVSYDDILAQYKDDATARRHVSDHRPAYADFVTTLPDDD